MGLALALAWWLWPESAAVVLPAILFGFLAVGTWGALYLAGGFWCEVVLRSESGRPEVALTFDDGPDPAATPALLDLLEARGVRASFFCIGEKARAHPELVKRIHTAGHVVGNHSDGHAPWTMFYPSGRMRRELEACQDAIATITGEPPRFFRPPYGHSSHVTGLVARAMGLPIIAWQARGFDLPGRATDRVVRRILKRVQAGGIILLHDGGRSAESVLACTRGVLDGLEAQGLEPVGLDELLRT